MRREFRQRYLFSGALTLKTGLHIGGGQAAFSPSDSPVVRTPDGKPYIPGSSFKGAFRSTVEKLAPLAGVWSCALIDAPAQVGPEEKWCVGTQGEVQRKFNELRRDEEWSETKLLAELDTKLCDTCKLFGSNYAASKISFSDLYTDDETEGLIQIRDGVAIDRDSERAVDNLLYNYEVVAPNLNFNLSVWLEDPTPTDLGLTCLGLSEFLSGFGFIGGKRSRGLGQCQLENLAIFRLDLSTGNAGQKLLKYLTNHTPADKMESIKDTTAFINERIADLLKEGQPHA